MAYFPSAKLAAAVIGGSVGLLYMIYDQKRKGEKLVRFEEAIDELGCGELHEQFGAVQVIQEFIAEDNSACEDIVATEGALEALQQLLASELEEIREDVADVIAAISEDARHWKRMQEAHIFAEVVRQLASPSCSSELALSLLATLRNCTNSLAPKLKPKHKDLVVRELLRVHTAAALLHHVGGASNYDADCRAAAMHVILNLAAIGKFWEEVAGLGGLYQLVQLLNSGDVASDQIHPLALQALKTCAALGEDFWPELKKAGAIKGLVSFLARVCGGVQAPLYPIELKPLIWTNEHLRTSIVLAVEALLEFSDEASQQEIDHSNGLEPLYILTNALPPACAGVAERAFFRLCNATQDIWMRARDFHKEQLSKGHPGRAPP